MAAFLFGKVIMGFGIDISSIGDLITAAHATTDALVNTFDAVADAIQAKTDNLPATPADEVGLVAAVKARTDNLPADPASESGGIASILTLAGVLDITSFAQESAPATDVNGTTWKDLLDRSSITKPTKIVGFKVTKGGTWAGNAKLRVVDGAGSKIFPHQDEYVEDTDFFDATLAVLNVPVVIPVADGYKLQFRSSDAGDGAGETLTLNQLDVIEAG